MYTFSPSGKRVVPNIGPLDAEIVIVSDSPSIDILPPSAETLLNKGLVHVGIDRNKCRVITCIPVRAPGDKFTHHDVRDVDWGREVFKKEISQLTKAKVFIALGPTPLEWLLGGKPPVIKWNAEREDKGFISAWRGSVIPVNWLEAWGPGNPLTPEDYLSLANLAPIAKRGAIVSTFHPTAVLRQFNWHPWFLLDLAKAANVAKNGVPPTVNRKWYRNNPAALISLANSDVNLLSYDTEIDPPIVGIATEDEVHVFEYDERYRVALRKLLISPKILKVAHNWLHDYAFTRKVLEIDVEPPIFDTVGGAMALNGALQKQLSPHISTRFTNWPYHKWLGNIDQLHYCGMDAVVTYDSYWPMLQQLGNKGLITIAGIAKPDDKPPMAIVDYDHKLLMPLMKMQERGFRIDEVERIKVETELSTQLETDSAKLSLMVMPIVESEIKRFKKPHLFIVDRKCDCCGGGTLQRSHCIKCFCMARGRDPNSTVKELAAVYNKSQKAIKEEALPCSLCMGTGKLPKRLPFNPDSPDQVADVIYRGLHIRPRKYKGVETIKAAQLDAIRDKHPIINSVVELSEVRADYDTVARLKAGADGLLHCEFDPWGTESGRIAGKEGLIEYGTNPMNLPKKARRFIIPREGYEFIYPDMAQVEARAMAVLSKDANLRRALYDVIPDLGKPDYHTWLQRAIRDYDNKCNISRDQSKRVSYAGFYGARPEQLATELTAEAFRKGDGQEISPEMAARILQVLYKVCPEVPRWQSHVCDEVLRTRQLLSPTGRVFHWVGYIRDRKSGELEREIKKQVWSRLPQDLGAYVLGLGLIDMYYTPNVWGNLLTPLVHCHDALLIEVPIDKVQDAKSLALSKLNRYIFGMDFVAEMSNKESKGVNWYVVS